MFHMFQYPTIGFKLTVKSPPNIVIKANPAQSESEGEWRYTGKLFMPGDNLEIRWDKK